MNTDRAEDGHTVKVHYTVRKENTVYGTSKDRLPLEFKIGGGSVISGLEKGVIGMEVGESKTITLPPEEGFGPVRDELIAVVNKDQLPEDFSPAIGKVIKLKSQGGQDLQAKVTEVKEDTVTLDANHPLAGQTLKLDLKLVAIA